MATAAMLHLLEARQKGVAQEIRNLLQTVPLLPALFVEERLTQQQSLCLRALLVQLAGEATTIHRQEADMAEEALLATACAVELLHWGMLAHEQVVEGSGIEGRFRMRSMPLGPLDRILVGDFLQAKGLSLLSAQSPSPHVLRVFSDLTEHMATKKLHLRERLLREEWTEQVYLERVYAKSAVLLASCCKLGGLVASGTPEAVEALTSYGYALGMALQIHLDSQAFRRAGTQASAQATTKASIQLSTQATLPSHAVPSLPSLRSLAERYCQKAKACLSVLPDSLTKYWLLRLPEQLLVGEQGESVCID